MDKRLEFKEQCQTVINKLEYHYSKQLEYSGNLGNIYDNFMKAVHIIENGESLNEINFSGYVRMFIDETTDFTNPLIKDIEKAGDIINELQG